MFRLRASFLSALNSKIVPYHRDSLDTTNGARLRSPSPITSPADDSRGCDGVFGTRQVTYGVLIFDIYNTSL